MANNRLKIIGMLLLIGILLLPVFAFANDEDDEGEEREAGRMWINSDVLREVTADDAGTTQFQVIGHELAPFLFLEGMTEVEAQRVARNEMFITTMRAGLFLEETPPTSFNTNEFVARLFQEGELIAHQNVPGGSPVGYFHIPVWVLVIGGIVGTCFLVYIAVALGQKLSHVIHKKREDEASV